MGIERIVKLVSVVTRLLQLDWVSAPAVCDGLLDDGSRLAVCEAMNNLYRWQSLAVLRLSAKVGR